MKKINLRDYYPYYTQDMIVEVPDEVALLLREYMLLEEAYRIRTYRYKAFYLALNSLMNSVTRLSKSSAEACSSSVPSWQIVSSGQVLRLDSRSGMERFRSVCRILVLRSFWLSTKLEYRFSQNCRSTSEKVAARLSGSYGSRAERKPWKQSQQMLPLARSGSMRSLLARLKLRSLCLGLQVPWVPARPLCRVNFRQTSLRFNILAGRTQQRSC